MNTSPEAVATTKINEAQSINFDAVFAILTVLLIVVAVLLINAFIASVFRNVAVMKGHHEKKYFWIPFLFGIVGYILVAALPDRNVQTQYIPVNRVNSDFKNQI